MKPRENLNAKLLYLLTGLLMVMVISTASLIRANTGYERRNRELVLQNDSIIAVNIKLTQAVEQQATLPKSAAAVKSSRLQ